MNIDNLEKQALLRRIQASQEFSSSIIYQRLLAYLVNASIDNKPPKELTIAIDVFDRSVDFNSSQDTIVRVHIYKLRKKLERYYINEGAEEKWKIEIPRGHYQVNFIMNPGVEIHPGKYRYATLVLSILLIFFIIYHFMQLEHFSKVKDNSPILVNSPVWAGLLNSPREKLIVPGDHFFYVENPFGYEKRVLHRRDSINTEKEFEIFQLGHPETAEFKALQYPLFPKNSIWPLVDILNVFFLANEPYTLKYCSIVTAQDLKNCDIIFVGSFHTLGILGDSFRNSRFSYHVSPNQLVWHDDVSDSVKTINDNSDPHMYHTDYGVVRKIPGPDGSIIFIFTGFHETGTIGIVKYFTELTSLIELEKIFNDRLGHIPAFYELIFSASGYDRTVYKTDILTVFEIDANKNVYNW